MLRKLVTLSAVVVIPDDNVGVVSALAGSKQFAAVGNGQTSDLIIVPL